MKMALKVNLYLFVLFVTLKSTASKCTNVTLQDNGVYAQLARTLVHEANWTVLATVSPIPDMLGFPMPHIVSMSDGPIKGRSTGYIYFYVPKSSLIPRSIKARNNVTALLTTGDRFDCLLNPEHMMCYTVMLSGSAALLKIGTNEYALGLRAFLSRHPEAIDAVMDNNFLLYKLILQYVFVVNSKGIMNYVSLRDYFTYSVTKA